MGWDLSSLTPPVNDSCDMHDNMRDDSGKGVYCNDKSKCQDTILKEGPDY